MLVGAHAFLPPFREAARTAPAGSAPQVGRGRGGRVCRPRQWQRSRRRGRSSDPMTGPASAVVRRVPCPPRTRLGGSSPPQRRLADHVAHEPLPDTQASFETEASGTCNPILRMRVIKRLIVSGVSSCWSMHIPTASPPCCLSFGSTFPRPSVTTIVPVRVPARLHELKAYNKRFYRISAPGGQPATGPSHSFSRVQCS